MPDWLDPLSWALTQLVFTAFVVAGMVVMLARGGKVGRLCALLLGIGYVQVMVADHSDAQPENPLYWASWALLVGGLGVVYLAAWIFLAASRK